MAASTIVCFTLGIGLRLFLFKTSFPKWLESRNEVVTPLTSWERVQEGLALQENYISPYSGDIFHETPLLLRCLHVLSRWPGGTETLFVMLDALIGYILLKISKSFGRYMLQKQAAEVKQYALNVDKLIMRTDDLHNIGVLLLVAHFFNPYSIMTCLSRSTAVFTNIAILLALLCGLQKNEFLSTFFVAVATYQSLYPFTLCVPLAIFFYKFADGGQDSYLGREAVASYTRTVGFYLVWLVGLLLLSYMMEGSFGFLNATYGFILTVPDLTPNVGVFWYFFTEMFEHFRVFFICVFQINAVVYTVPLAVKLRDSPIFLMYMLIFLTGVFKSYPSYADAALYFCLLPLWKHVFSYMRNKFVVGCMYISCIVFAPILYHLWIYAGSANANFYFAITLTYSTAAIFLVTDLLFGFLRREFDLMHGLEHKLDNGEEGQVILE